MPVAFRKATFTSKLVFKDEVSGEMSLWLVARIIV